jgi:hypothetical protein
MLHLPCSPAAAFVTDSCSLAHRAALVDEPGDSRSERQDFPPSPLRIHGWAILQTTPCTRCYLQRLATLLLLPSAYRDVSRNM